MNTLQEKGAVPMLLKAAVNPFVYQERSAAGARDGLSMLTYGVYKIMPGAASGRLAHLDEEALLFMVNGISAEVSIAGRRCALAHYDTLYVPRSTVYTIANPSDVPAEIIICRAPADEPHPVHHSSWKTISSDESRIRHLKGKDVFLMFDVTEKAEKLVAGYTVYRPFTRAWPAHNHTDQEEVYIFIKGRGAMEVYLSEEEKSFVTSVDEMDAVTIPFLWYHPVFSQEQELHFIWCIAGKRYWVGDKDKDFMKGAKATLTT